MTEKHTKDTLNKNGQDPNEKGMDRRKFIKNTGLVMGGVIGGSLFGGLLTNQFQSEPASKETVVEDDGKNARIFFNRKEDFDVLSAAVERIYPEDDNGPGAVWLGVPYFIDRQLAGEFGNNGKEYMQGPFKDINNSERYQSRLNRGDMMLEGLRTMNQVSLKKNNETFDKIEGEKQDEILAAFEEGKVKMKGASTESFFQLLRQMTIEGAYADPLYGGNRDMMGWKMREFPGPRPAYINEIESEEFVKHDPISLKDYQP